MCRKADQCVLFISQLISYAGYLNADGTVTGDPMNVEITDVGDAKLLSIGAFFNTRPLFSGLPQTGMEIAEI